METAEFLRYCVLTVVVPGVVCHRLYHEWEVGSKLPLPWRIREPQLVHIFLSYVHPKLQLQGGWCLLHHRDNHHLHDWTRWDGWPLNNFRYPLVSLHPYLSILPQELLLDRTWWEVPSTVQRWSWESAQRTGLTQMNTSGTPLSWETCPSFQLWVSFNRGLNYPPKAVNTTSIKLKWESLVKLFLAHIQKWGSIIFGTNIRFGHICSTSVKQIIWNTKFSCSKCDKKMVYVSLPVKKWLNITNYLLRTSGSNGKCIFPSFI